MRSFRCLAPAVLALLLAGCGHVPVSTLYQLRKFDPASFDPVPVRIAVRLDDAVLPRAGTTEFKITTWMPEKAEHVFILEPVPVASEPGLTPFMRVGEGMHVFRFAPADVPRVRALQEATARAKGAGTARGKVEIAVGSKACRKRDLPSGALLSTTLIRTESQGPYLVLLKDVDLNAEARKHGENLEAEIPPCE